MLKVNDRAIWIGETRYVLGSPFLSQGETVTITAVSPDQKSCFVMVSNGSEYGWLSVDLLILTSPFVVSFFPRDYCKEIAPEA